MRVPITKVEHYVAVLAASDSNGHNADSVAWAAMQRRYALGLHPKRLSQPSGIGLKAAFESAARHEGGKDMASNIAWCKAKLKSLETEIEVKEWLASDVGKKCLTDEDANHEFAARLATKTLTEDDAKMLEGKDKTAVMKRKDENKKKRAQQLADFKAGVPYVKKAQRVGEAAGASASSSAAALIGGGGGGAGSAVFSGGSALRVLGGFKVPAIPAFSGFSVKPKAVAAASRPAPPPSAASRGAGGSSRANVIHFVDNEDD